MVPSVGVNVSYLPITAIASPIHDIEPGYHCQWSWLIAPNAEVGPSLQKSLRVLMSEKKLNRHRDRRMITLTGFIEDNLGACAVGFGLGTLVGLSLAAPLFGWELPKEATPVFASAASAFIAAGAAGFWAQRTVYRGDREACRTVGYVIRPITIDVMHVVDALESEDPGLVKIRRALQAIKPMIDATKNRLDLLSSVHWQMRDGKGVAIADANIALEKLRQALTSALGEITSEEALTPGLLAITPPPTQVRLNPRTAWHTLARKHLLDPLQELIEANRRVGHPVDNLRAFYSDQAQQIRGSGVMKGKVKKFRELRSWQLCALGGLAAFASALIVYLLGRVWPLYVEALEAKEVFSWPGLVVSFYLGWIAVMGIVFAAIGKRCGELLYQRHLD
jgi:hypothetical protein